MKNCRHNSRTVEKLAKVTICRTGLQAELFRPEFRTKIKFNRQKNHIHNFKSNLFEEVGLC